MPSTKIKKYQSVVDFATQYAGSADAAINVAIGNGISMTDDIEAGKVLQYEETDTTVASYFRKNIFDVITKPYILRPQGIGYWRIEIDFVVTPASS